MRSKISMLSVALLFFVATNGSAMTVTYDIGPKSIGNWSASFLHTADRHPGPSHLDLDGNGRRDRLYMSGKAKAVTGYLTGNWNGTILSNITGMIGGFSVLGGSLGGAYYSGTRMNPNPLWSLSLDTIGTFYFESMRINKINGRMLTLWGQNEAAYAHTCGHSDQADSDGCDPGYGMDLYGKRVATSLPEPGTVNLVLLAWFLCMAITFVTRYRAKQVLESADESAHRNK